jgi:hypothetical protein
VRRRTQGERTGKLKERMWTKYEGAVSSQEQRYLEKKKQRSTSLEKIEKLAEPST